MGKWENCTFDEAVNDVTRYGTKIKTEDYLLRGKYPIIDQGQKSIAGFTNFANGIYDNVPVIVFGDHTRIFKYVDFPFFLGADGVKLLKVNRDDLHPKFVYHYLSSARIPDTGYNRHFKWLKEIKIPLPPLAEQKRIADMLDRASVLIEKRKTQIEKLDLLIKSRFIQMFGDPVTNPMEWDVVFLKTVCDVRDGTHDSPKYMPEGFPLLTSKNFTQGYIDFNGANYVSEADFVSINRRSKVDYGDIVMPMIGTIGCPVIIDTDKPFAIKNVALIKFNNPCIVNVYLKALLSSYFFEYSIRQNNRGGTQKFIALGDIRCLQIPLPPISVQASFVSFVQQVESQKTLFQQSLATMELNYKSLMQKCFRGELNCPRIVGQKIAVLLDKSGSCTPSPRGGV